MPQNKFEILRSRVMQCGVEERVVRSTRTVVVKCFKCGEEGHKCRECLSWERKLKRVVRPNGGKALSQMVIYLICDLRKEFFKRVQARFR